jgi:hypothetical protein
LRIRGWWNWLRIVFIVTRFGFRRVELLVSAVRMVVSHIAVPICLTRSIARNVHSLVSSLHFSRICSIRAGLEILSLCLWYQTSHLLESTVACYQFQVSLFVLLIVPAEYHLRILLFYFNKGVDYRPRRATRALWSKYLQFYLCTISVHEMRACY